MYAKVFTQIFDSSIADDYKLRHFFMDLLVLADINGVVDMTPTAIAGRTRIPLEEVQGYLASLEGPDTESRTQEHEGRRIVRLDEHRTWGWCILNYHKFRAIASEDQRKALTRERVRRFREKSNAPVTLSNAGNATQTQTERQTQTQKVQSGKPDGEKVPLGGYHKDTRTVLHILNETCGRHFRELAANLSVISARLREPGVDLAGVRLMLARQCKRWKNTPQAEYLRPETLFGKTKFDSYYAARTLPVHSEAPKHNPRNDGIASGGTDYGEAAKRKLERQALEAANRRASEAQGT